MSHVAGLAVLKLAVLAALVMDPGAEAGVGLVLGRDHAVAVDGLVGLEVVEAVPPGGLVRVPDEANGLELGDAGLGHVGLATLDEEHVVPALLLDPKSELGTVGVGEGDEAVAELGLVGLEVGVVAGPGCLLRVPCELKLVEGSDALGGDVGGLAVAHELVLLPLLGDPRSELGVGPVSAGDYAVAVLGLVLPEEAEHAEPLEVLGLGCGTGRADGGGVGNGRERGSRRSLGRGGATLARLLGRALAGGGSCGGHTGGGSSGRVDKAQPSRTEHGGRGGGELLPVGGIQTVDVGVHVAVVADGVGVHVARARIGQLLLLHHELHLLLHHELGHHGVGGGEVHATHAARGGQEGSAEHGVHTGLAGSHGIGRGGGGGGRRPGEEGIAIERVHEGGGGIALVAVGVGGGGATVGRIGRCCIVAVPAVAAIASGAGTVGVGIGPAAEGGHHVHHRRIHVHPGHGGELRVESCRTKAGHALHTLHGGELGLQLESLLLLVAGGLRAGGGRRSVDEGDTTGVHTVDVAAGRAGARGSSSGTGIIVRGGLGYGGCGHGRVVVVVQSSFHVDGNGLGVNTGCAGSDDASGRQEARPADFVGGEEGVELISLPRD